MFNLFRTFSFASCISITNPAQNDSILLHVLYVWNKNTKNDSSSVVCVCWKM